MNGLALAAALILTQAPETPAESAAPEPAAAAAPTPAPDARGDDPPPTSAPAPRHRAEDGAPAGPARPRTVEAAPEVPARRRTELAPSAAESAVPTVVTTTVRRRAPAAAPPTTATATATPTAPPRPVPGRDEAERAARTFLEALARGDATALAGLASERFSFDGEVQAGRESIRRTWRDLLVRRPEGPQPAVGALELLESEDAAARLGKPPARLAPLVRRGVTIAIADVGGRTVVLFVAREGGRMAILGMHD